MDFDKEYRKHFIGLNRKVRDKFNQKKENGLDILEEISDEEIRRCIESDMKVLSKNEEFDWKVSPQLVTLTGIDKDQLPISYMVSSDMLKFKSKEFNEEGELYIQIIVQHHDFIDIMSSRFNGFKNRIILPDNTTSESYSPEFETKLAFFVNSVPKDRRFFYICVKATNHPVFNDADGTSNTASIDELYTKEELIPLKAPNHIFFDQNGKIKGICYPLTRSNLYLALRIAMNAVVRKIKEIKNDEMFESVSSLGLAKKVDQKYKDKDSIEEVSDYKYIKIARNLLYGYSKICYSDLIDSMNAVCKLLVKHLNVKDKASGAFVFKDKLNLMLGDLGTSIQINPKEKAALRGSILMNHFVMKTHTKNVFDDIPSSKKFGSQYQALFKLSADFADFVVSVAHERPELFDFLDTLENVTKEYDYTTFKKIFSSLNEGTTNLGFADRISKKYKEGKENIDKAFEISTVKEAVDFFTDALKLKGYQEVEDVYFIPDEEQLYYDISFRSLSNGEDYAILSVKFGKYFPYKEIKKSRQWANFYIGRDNGIVSISTNKKLVGLFKRFLGPEYKEGYGWIASSSIFVGIANFMKDYEEETQEIQEGLANKIINKFNDKKEEQIDNINDGSKEVAKDSAEFISMLIEEGRLRDMIPEGYEDNKPRVRDGDQFDNVTSYQLYTINNGGDYDAEKKVNVMGYAKKYWPVMTYSSMQIITMIGRGWYCNDRNLMSLRIRFGKNSNADNDSPYTWITNIEVGKMSSNTSWNPKDYGPFTHIDLTRFNKSANINEDGTIALTRTNAIIILEIFRSYFRHRDDKVKAKVKKRGFFINSRGEYVDSPNWVYDIEDKEVWKILRGLNTKKSNKAFFLNMMKHCWSKDFNIK